MEHIWPDKLETFWKNQVHRGAHSAPTYYFFTNSNLLITLLREVLKSIRDILKILLIFPPLIYTIKLSKFTDGGFRNIPDLLTVHVIEKIAIIFGNYKGVFRIIKNKQNSEK
jgi:hypothetical protein